MMWVRVAGSHRARQPLQSVIHVAHSRRPWLSATLHILTTLLHSLPSPSLFSCPLPVIACQINVPLCSQAQKLSRHIQPPAPLFFFHLVLSHTATPPPPPPPPPPLWSICPPLPLCFHAHIHSSLSTHVHSGLSSLLFSPDSGFLTPCCLSSSACSVSSLEMATHTPLLPSIFSRSISLCVFVLPHTNVPS